MYNFKEYRYIKKLFKNASRTKELEGKSIIINTVRSYKGILDRELFLGKILALNGSEIVILLDDGVFKHWDTVQVTQFPHILKINEFPLNPIRTSINSFKFLIYNLYLKFMQKIALYAFMDENIRFIKYSIVKGKINPKLWKNYTSVAEASTIRFFEDSNLDFSHEKINHYYKLSLLNALISRAMGQYVFETLKPDYFLTSHGIYSAWGPAYDYLKIKQVPCYTYIGGNTHTQNSTDIYLTDASAQSLSTDKFWQEFRKNSLTEDQKTKAIAFLNNRSQGSVVDLKLYYQGVKKIFTVDKNDGYKYHIALFPNLIWEGNLNEKHVIFDGYLDWIFSTINYAKNKKDTKFYIKAHPGELLFSKENQRIVNIIKRNMDLSDCKNIELIPPETKVDVYAFLKSGIDLAIVYDGLLGVEIPFLKIPTIVCTKGGFSSVDGVNVLLSDKKEYFYYLDNINELSSKFLENYDYHLENILKFVYWYIYENSLSLPVIDLNARSGTNLLQVKKKDLIIQEKLKKKFLL
ncbi:MAG: hypothetical protein JW891_03310 [Candidatus Lokiarchaeota archaeon]|nr:hypothetical protein [Candidatus Lokiarchaeota archaeon]